MTPATRMCPVAHFHLIMRDSGAAAAAQQHTDLGVPVPEPNTDNELPQVGRSSKPASLGTRKILRSDQVRGHLKGEQPSQF